jgi:hypothetical protein
MFIIIIILVDGIHLSARVVRDEQVHRLGVSDPDFQNTYTFI